MRPIQLLARCHRALRPVTRPGRSAGAEAGATRWVSRLSYRPPFVWAPGGDSSAEEIRLGQFTLVGHRVDLGEEDGAERRRIRWADETPSVHWKRMFHSLEWLAHLDPAEGTALLQSYCSGLPEDPSLEAMHPWPAAFRVQTVIRWHAQHGTPDWVAGHVARWANLVERNLEWRLLGNHLLKNAVALSMAGRALDGPASGRWRRVGDRTLIGQLKTAIRADGSHEELCPMYHALVLQDLLDLLSMTGPDESIYRPLTGAVEAMASFLGGVLHPDGEIPCLNDSGLGVAPRPALLIAKAESLGLRPYQPRGTRSYRDSGLHVLETGPWWAIFDAGPVCPDHLPGHGHADSLMIEASVQGERLFVDTGVSTYGDVATRDVERATAAHNTVRVAGRNSSDVYGLFRTGQRARVHRVRSSAGPGLPWVEAEHDGYRALSGRPTHVRRVGFESDRTLMVTDQVTGEHNHPWESRWHLAPGWEIEPIPGRADSLLIHRGPDGPLVEATCDGGKLRLEPASVCLRFGHPVATLAIIGQAREPGSTVTWRFACR
jgi:uncharacterized heparinase superfamily protein